MNVNIGKTPIWRPPTKLTFLVLQVSDNDHRRFTKCVCTRAERANASCHVGVRAGSLCREGAWGASWGLCISIKNERWDGHPPRDRTPRPGLTPASP